MSEPDGQHDDSRDDFVVDFPFASAEFSHVPMVPVEFIPYRQPYDFPMVGTTVNTQELARVVLN